MFILEGYTFIPRLKRPDLEPSTWGKQSKQQSGPGHWSCVWSFTQHSGIADSNGCFSIFTWNHLRCLLKQILSQWGWGGPLILHF